MRRTSTMLFSTAVACALALSGCGSQAPSASSPGAGQNSESLSGTIAVSGAFALYPMMTVWADEFTKLHPDVQFDVQGGGAGKGMTDTLAGAVDIGMISRKIKPEEEAQGAFWVAVAKDAVFPVISAQNPVLATWRPGASSRKPSRRSSSPVKSRPGAKWSASPRSRI